MFRPLTLEKQTRAFDNRVALSVSRTLDNDRHFGGNDPAKPPFWLLPADRKILSGQELRNKALARLLRITSDTTAITRNLCALINSL
jgi:hypothetical protein